MGSLNPSRSKSARRDCFSSRKSEPSCRGRKPLARWPPATRTGMNGTPRLRLELKTAPGIKSRQRMYKPGSAHLSSGNAGAKTPCERLNRELTLVHEALRDPLGEAEPCRRLGNRQSP